MFMILKLLRNWIMVICKAIVALDLYVALWMFLS